MDPLLLRRRAWTATDLQKEVLQQRRVTSSLVDLATESSPEALNLQVISLILSVSVLVCGVRVFSSSLCFLSCFLVIDLSGE